MRGKRWEKSLKAVYPLFAFMKEVWKSIKGYEGLYEASNFGRVKNLKRNKFIGISRKGKGYLSLDLSGNGKSLRTSVHRLVGEYFVSNPFGKPDINHLNGIRNDNRAVNLEWCTQSENNRHAFRLGLAKPRAKLTIKQVKKIRELRAIIPRVKIRILAERYGVSKRNIVMIQQRETWKNI